MELEWKTCTVGMLESSSESVAESPFDLDLQMPDYMPDIHRILHCAVCPQIQSVSASADRVNAEGSGLVRVLYSSEDGRTHVYEQSFPIRRTAPENIQGSAVRVNATTEYVNCRAAGQRRIHANGSVSLRFSSNKRQEMHIPTASDAEGLQTQTMPFSALSMTSCAEKIFAMSEVVELESDPPIAGVLHSSTFVRMDTSKAVQDKLLVKGEAVTQIWYCSAEDGKTLVRFPIPCRSIKWSKQPAFRKRIFRM